MSISLFSVVIICNNEEKRIAATLEAALKVSDDVVVVDSYSTDQTMAIVHQMGVRAFQKEWKGYSEQKNFGNQQAKYDWILSIDADEVIGAELAESLKSLSLSSDQDAYQIPFRTNYCGKWMNYGVFRNEKHIRLFNKKKIQWNTSGVHEGLTLSGEMKVGKLKGHILHYSVDHLEQHLQKINHYTTMHAESMFAANKKASVFKIIFSPSFQFVREYILQLGFMDGFYGLVSAQQRANYFFLKYAKLRILMDKASAKKSK
jgi:glycosyltransferase involved in cell wall biosynthesis